MKIFEVNFEDIKDSFNDYINSLELKDNESYVILGKNGLLINNTSTNNRYIAYKNIVSIDDVFISEENKNTMDIDIYNREFVYTPRFYINTVDEDYHPVISDKKITLKQYINHKILFKEIKTITDFIKKVFACHFIENPEIETIKDSKEYKSLKQELEDIRIKIICKIDSIK